MSGRLVLLARPFNYYEEFTMLMTKSASGAAIATAAALLFSVASITTASADEAKIHCDGVNSCKGKGFVEMTQKQCDAAKAKK